MGISQGRRWIAKAAAVVGVLIKQVQDGSVGCLQRMGTGDLDQLRRLRHTVDIGSLFDGQAHHGILRRAIESCRVSHAPITSHCGPESSVGTMLLPTKDAVGAI
jgi:hypothetical protein